MAFKGNICTKVINGGIVAVMILANTLPGFTLNSLRDGDSYFDRFGSEKTSIVSYVNNVIDKTPDVYVINLEPEKELHILMAANTPAYENTINQEERLTQEQFYAKVEAMGIDRTKKAELYTDEEITKIVELMPYRFSDITGTEWYIKDLALMTSKGIINGMGSEGLIFAGANTVTRAEFWAMIGRLQGYKEMEQKEIDFILGRGFGDKLKYNERFKGMQDEWWFSYFMHLDGIPVGTYSREEMKLPCYRGEIASLVSRAIVNEYTHELGNMMAKVKYFNDTPLTVKPSSECQWDSPEAGRLMQEFGVSLPYYYPPFQRVVAGTEPMTEATLRVINGLNYFGIMCGMPDGSSGWNKQLTRAEAIATLARAFRPAQRLPVSKRQKDLSGLNFNAGEYNPVAYQEVNKDIGSNNSGVESGSMLIGELVETYNEDWDMTRKKLWFEESLGFKFEFLESYETRLGNHMTLLGITGDTFEAKRENWHKFINEDLGIEFSSAGVFAYVTYCEANKIPLIVE
jgi:hypothetical protein